MRVIFIVLTAIALLGPTTADARAETINCTPINTLPTVIPAPGVYCLKKDLGTSMTSGNAITINANSVTIDLNGFKLGGLGAGVNTQANGVFAANRLNVTIRNGSVRGFMTGIYLNGGSGHLVEDMRVESSRQTGILVSGDGSILRRNLISTTGGGTASTAYGIYSIGDGNSIVDNMIDRVTETYQGIGIMCLSSKSPVIARNEVREVSDTISGESVGIWLSNTTRAVAKDNYVINTVPAKQGIYGNGSVDACIGNVVSAVFTSPLFSCDYSSGNHVY
jgi:hypothetical protein